VATARGTYELTRGYLCACLILSVKGSDAEAGQAALMGVWAADDVAGRQGAEDGGATERPGEGEAVEAAREAATRCRRLAVAYLEADRKRGPTFAATRPPPARCSPLFTAEWATSMPRTCRRGARAGGATAGGASQPAPRRHGLFVVCRGEGSQAQTKA